MHSEQANPSPAAGDASQDTGAMPTLEQLSAELAAAREALEAMRESGLRERADLENQRRRMARDLEQARRFANERLLADLLPVLDSLEAGLTAEAADSDRLREGMDLTLRQLSKVASDNGLEVIAPEGERFDPERHQAMTTMVDPAVPDDTVVRVYQKGYSLNQRLLRPALVVVSKTTE